MWRGRESLQNVARTRKWGGSHSNPRWTVQYNKCTVKFQVYLSLRGYANPYLLLLSRSFLATFTVLDPLTHLFLFTFQAFKWNKIAIYIVGNRKTDAIDKPDHLKIHAFTVPLIYQKISQITPLKQGVP